MVTVFIIIKKILKNCVPLNSLLAHYLWPLLLLRLCWVGQSGFCWWTKKPESRADFWWLIVQDFGWWLLLWLEARAAVPDQSAPTGQQEQSQNQRSSSKLRTAEPAGPEALQSLEAKLWLNQDIHVPLAHFRAVQILGWLIFKKINIL